MSNIHDAATSTLTREGRVLIPAAMRRELGLRAGDRLTLQVIDSTVMVTSTRSLTEAMWAKNTGGDAGDAGATVRAAREHDRSLVDADRESDADDRSPEQVTADLLSALGLSAE